MSEGTKMVTRRLPRQTRQLPPKQAVTLQRPGWLRRVFEKPSPTIYQRCLAFHIFAAGEMSELS